MNTNNNSVLTFSVLLVIIGLVSAINSSWGIVSAACGAVVAFHRIAFSKRQWPVVPIVDDGKSTVILLQPQLDLDTMSMVYQSDAFVEPLYRK